jgi:ferritin-like metal-binding protein YciE
MSFRNLEELLDYQLQELHAAETHAVKDLPAILQGAFSEELKSLLRQHIQESESHEQALAEILKKRATTPHLGRCKVVETLLKQGKAIAETRGNSVVLDVELSFILRMIETYEQCAYDSAKTLAEALGLDEIAAILQNSARDEQKMEQSCTVLGEDMIDALHLASSLASAAGVSTQTGGVA